ncbi:MAG: ribokinase [Pseudomonadota bacterium]|nr:ribokinase [Pseudomonadota bacterium]
MTVVVFGSINIDVTAYSERLPRPGETLHGDRHVLGLGGKGANQAAAAGRLGAPTSLIGRVGSDPFGAEARRLLADYGIGEKAILIDDEHGTGIAIIHVEPSGENAITIIGGANLAMDTTDVERGRSVLEAAKVLLLQLEVPLAASLRAAACARAAGARVIFDPAPAPTSELVPAILAAADIITPNEIETEALCGVRPDDTDSAVQAALLLHGLGAATVLVKLGAKGVLVSTPKTHSLIPAFAVRPVDTVAAGDCFNGGLAFALARGDDLFAAARFAAACGALATTRYGAAAAAPTLSEVDRFVRGA